MKKGATHEKRIIGDISSNRFFSIGTYLVLFVVAAVMTALNIATEKGVLTYCTGAFAALCLVNVLFTFLGSFAEAVAKGLFAVEVLCMFTFFLVSGNPEGFSAIWICMLPSLGMFFFNRYRGTALCVAMFLILVFFLWVPYGRTLLQYEYTPTFCMRFPVLFVAFHMLAFLLETLRMNAYNEMRRLQNYYKERSVRDPLTDAFNRQGMYSVLETGNIYAKADSLGVAMLDIDDFKKVNDIYGHAVGDEVLKQFATILRNHLDCLICRWGGEEFVAVFPGGKVTGVRIEKVRKAIEEFDFVHEDVHLHVTASIGICLETHPNVKRIESLISRADEALYRAKSAGKNRIVYYEDIQVDEPV